MVFEENQTKIDRGELSYHTQFNEKNRYKKDIKDFLGTKFITNIKYKELTSFVKHLTDRNLSGQTIRVYLVFIRKVFKQAMIAGAIASMPLIPTITVKQKARGWFSNEEYEKLKDAAEELAKPGVIKNLRLRSRYSEIDEEIRNFILFMVNTFVRPGEAKLLQHKHIELVEQGRESYLRINTDFSKTVNSTIISMKAGAGIYTNIMEYQLERGYGSPEDYVFYPKYTNNRDQVLYVIRNQLDLVMKHAGLKMSGSGQSRTIYSLRHTAIMMRLTKSENLDLITLARACRTSVEMIDKFYARHLTAEMNITTLQSIRK
jgi:integrase